MKTTNLLILALLIAGAMGSTGCHAMGMHAMCLHGGTTTNSDGTPYFYRGPRDKAK